MGCNGWRNMISSNFSMPIYQLEIKPLLFVEVNASILLHLSLCILLLIHFRQFGNLLAVRTRKLSIFQHSPFNNHHLFIAMLISTCSAIIIIYVPFFQQVFLTYPIPLEYWVIPIPLALLLLILDELRKLLARMYPQSIIGYMAW
jgi:magnesium-transporting ATPase (P-type)